MRKICRILKPFTVFVVGGFAYGLIEVLSRGYTHISMGVLGGAAMCLIHKLNSGRRSVLRVAARIALSGMFITAAELITGELLNVRLGMHIWDYSGLPFNLDGQICLFFSVIWLGLSAAGTVLDDLVRAAIFGEPLKMNVSRRRTVQPTEQTITE